MELYGTVDDTLRMYQHLYLTGVNAKEPFGLDDLKTFVHHCRGVDGNLGTHIPCGMAQRIGLGDGSQLFHGEVTERTTTGGEQYLLDGVVVFAYQTLEDGGVLAIDRQNGGVVLLSQLQNQLASHHQRLLVSQGDGLMCLDGVDGG